MASLPAGPPGKSLGTGCLVPKHLCLRAACLASDAACKCILEASEKFSALVRSTFQRAWGLAANPRPSKGFYCPGLNSGDHFRAKRTYECQVLAGGMFQELSGISWCETQCTHHAETEWIQLKIFESSLFQFSSVTQSYPALCNPNDYSTPGFPLHHQLPEFTQTHVHWVCDAIQPSHPLLSPSPAAFNLSQHQGFFSNESVLRIRWPEYWNFSFSISPSNEYSGLISFQIDWFDLLVVQGTLKSLLQHQNFEFLKASILQRAAFFMVQLSHPYMTTQEILPEYLPNVKHRSLFLGLQRGKQRIPAQNCGWINRCTMDHSAGWELGSRMSRRNTNSLEPGWG